MNFFLINHTRIQSGAINKNRRISNDSFETLPVNHVGKATPYAKQWKQKPAGEKYPSYISLMLNSFNTGFLKIIKQGHNMHYRSAIVSNTYRLQGNIARFFQKYAIE